MKKRKRSSSSLNWKRTFLSIWEFLADNKKKVMPIVLLVCVAITILIAIRANRIAADQAIADADEQESSSAVSFEVTEAKLMQDINPEINALVSTYFDAYVSGDVSELNTGLYRTLDEIETVTIEERARYIEDVANLTVYTKTGPVPDSWVAYAYTDVRYIGCDDYVPAMLSLYICKDEDGIYYINADENSQSVKDYITAVSLQDDVVDLYNRVNVEYAEKLESNTLLGELVAAIYAEIDESVGERLVGVTAQTADADNADGETASPETQVADAQTDASTQEPAGPQVPKEVKIRAKTTVNVRKSDSTEADVLGKAREGEEYVRIAEQGNGWSKISFAGSAAYVKSEFFEVVTPEEQDGNGTTDGQTASSPDTAGTGASAASDTASTKASTASSTASTGASTASSAASTKASTASSTASTKASTASSTAGTGASAASGAASTKASTAANTASSKASTASSAAGTGASSASNSASTKASTSASTGKTGTDTKTTISGTGSKTVTTSLRLRKEPSTEAEVITTLYGGAKVNVTKIRDDGWSEVEYKGKKGYMKTEFLQD